MKHVDAYVPGRGNPGYVVRGYDLDLDYRIDTNHLRGRATIAADATDGLGRVSFDLEQRLKVAKVRVDGAPARWNQHHAKLDVTPRRTITDGSSFTVDVQYAGHPAPAPSAWGPVGWEELTDGVLAANQPSGAPSWFPCNDLPAHKAPFRIAVTVPSGYRVVANGRLASRMPRAGRTTWAYEQPEPMAPYLAVIHVGRYELVELAAEPVTVQAVVPPAHVADARRALARQVEMVDVFSERFGPYPYANGYVVVVTDDELEIPLEATGLSTFGTNHLDGHHERLIAHELAHQWFGNSVTASEWRHIWLHEGFACYAEWIWSEASGSDAAAARAAHHHARLRDLPQDLLLGDPGADDMFDDRVYKRGALTLHALRVEIGDDSFWEVLRRWAAEHQHGAVGTDEFVALAEAVAGRPLDDLFDAWLWATALPALP